METKLAPLPGQPMNKLLGSAIVSFAIVFINDTHVELKRFKLYLLIAGLLVAHWL